jgi:hypothetical protein
LNEAAIAAGDDEMRALNATPDPFHPECKYSHRGGTRR